jgi:hypothetical protein
MRCACEVVEVLFPITSPIPVVPFWSIRGLLSHVTTDKHEKERKAISKKRLGSETENQ